MQAKKKKPYASALILGMLSIGSYFLIFSNQETVTDVTTRSGYFIAVPIVAAFYFSFVHGAFASSILSVLGIEAKKKK
jgi:hypothetical protein